ncbi:hypothetical protein BDN70DRAFT_850452 [Pholiota conissans]|uniref:Uncharacterized protein n=1 Tax=Pholiota conissans TaxID=109636 RepID=A0A9P6D5K8_9AGAR|nr:hypothetical protein BDN70DRAFT_850452 [Pholiota conissans]
MEVQSEPQRLWRSAVKAYGEYPFDEDESYQQGLASILKEGTIDSNASEEVKERIIRGTRVFYFNKITGHAVTMDEARDYEIHIGVSTGPGSPVNANDENRVLSFAELKELIETGNVDKIPNNKIIPEGLNDAPPSESTAQVRKKPWETATA